MRTALRLWLILAVSFVAARLAVSSLARGRVALSEELAVQALVVCSLQWLLLRGWRPDRGAR